MRIEIPSDCDKISILFSGGMDSSILLYLLLKQIKENNQSIPIYCYTMPLTESRRVVNRMRGWFLKKDYDYTQIFLKKKYLIRVLVENILITSGGYVYSGCNKVLTQEFTPTVYIEGDTPPVRGLPFNDHHIRPFIELDKKQIMELYVKENVLDLLQLTKSCGVIGQEKCGGCYFCMERQWAATLLEIDDQLL